MKKSIFGFVALTALSASAFASGTSAVGMGNPAAINCLKLGGVLESYETSRGQDSNCVIEEWSLYRAMSSRNLLKPRRYGSGGAVGMANPASVNCIDIKGTLRIQDSPRGQYGLCVVAQWDLFKAINVTNEAQ